MFTKHTHTCTIPKDLCDALLMELALLVLMMERLVQVKLAWAVSSGVFADSAHQHDTDVGQRRGNAAYSSHSGEQKEKCNGSGLWLDNSLATFKEQSFWKQITFKRDTDSDIRLYSANVLLNSGEIH